ncbi:hypothetical protein [Streptomyces sp. NPDC050388]|uniref:hypothetical protein n=1 Tax=Streptomyces sp. NPDC050388 TaxID=3155781 RepID=UPI0034444A13
MSEALEAREAAARGEADRLREQIAGLSGELSRLEGLLFRLRITRETVDEVLAGGPSTAAGGKDASKGAAEALPAAEAEPDGTVMSPEYQAIIGLFATSGAAMRCKEVCVVLGLGSEARHVAGMRSKLKRLVERGILAETLPGLFKADGQELGW